MHPAINPTLYNNVINKSRKGIKSSGVRMLFSVALAFNNLVSLHYAFMFFLKEIFHQSQCFKQNNQKKLTMR